jgi:carbon storage regulator
MLVLTRKSDEGIVIDGKIVIRVLGVQAGRVRLGIEAPGEILVLREEVASRLGLNDSDREALPALLSVG